MSDPVKQPQQAAAREHATAPTALPSATVLHESLQRLISVKPTYEAFAIEAVTLLTKAAGAEAAALLASDPRASRVRLLAAIGAEKEAFRDLIEPRGLWISLRCLNERQINVITAAQSNPFVPQSLVNAINQNGLSIAALPVYHMDVPVGVVILFSSNPNTFTDSVLYTVSKAMRACSRLLGEAWGPSRGHRRNLRALTPAPAPETEPVKEAPAVGPTNIRDLLERERHRVVQLEGELKGLRAAGDRLPSLQAEVERLNLQAEEARAAAEAARSRAAQLDAERVEAENRARAAAATLEALLEARNDQQEQIEAALAVARERHGAVAQIDERMHQLLERVGQVDHLGAALRASEAARDRLESDVSRLGQQVETLQSARMEIQQALQERTDALQSARAEAQTLALRLNDLDTRIVELQAREEAASARAALADELETRRAELEQELNAARAALAEREAREAAAAAAWQLRVDELAAERDRLRDEALNLQEELQGLADRHGAAIEAGEQQRTAARDGQDAVARLEAERERLRTRVTELERALATARDTAQVVHSGRWLSSVPNPLLDRELLEIFGTEAREHLASCEQLFLMLERQNNDRELQDALLRRFHTLKGAAAAVGLDAVVSQIHDGETVLELIERGKHRADGPTIDFLLRLTESITALILQALGTPAEGRRVISDVRAELVRLGVQQVTPPRDVTPPPPLRPPVARNAATDTDAAMLHVQAAQVEVLAQTLGRLERGRDQACGQIRDLYQLRDHFIGWRTRLADERTAQDSYAATPGIRHDLVAETGDLAADLARIIDLLDHRDRDLAALTGELYRQIDQLRRVPLDTIFRRLPRVVRDAARQTGKQVVLKSEGGDLLLERQLSEALFSPLLHLVRNAIAHGIELPDVRRASGKNAQGTVYIAASLRAPADDTASARSDPLAPDWIEVLVHDDGAGLDTAKILRKARERGLVAGKARLSKAETIALICEPGFTTVAQVDELAGRGVGMDAIVHRIKTLGGSVEIDSEPGQGMTVRLAIPVRTSV